MPPAGMATEGIIWRRESACTGRTGLSLHPVFLDTIHLLHRVLDVVAQVSVIPVKRQNGSQICFRQSGEIALTARSLVFMREITKEEKCEPFRGSRSAPAFLLGNSRVQALLKFLSE